MEGKQFINLLKSIYLTNWDAIKLFDTKATAMITLTGIIGYLSNSFMLTPKNTLDFILKIIAVFSYVLSFLSFTLVIFPRYSRKKSLFWAISICNNFENYDDYLKQFDQKTLQSIYIQEILNLSKIIKDKQDWLIVQIVSQCCAIISSLILNIT